MRTLVLLLWAALLGAQSKDVAAGENTFRSHCAPCHGLHGEGGRGPNLASGRFYHGSSDADLLKNISEGIPGTEMPGLFYMEDRIRQIIAYIRSLHVSEQNTGDGTRGAALFQSKGCTGCHRAGAQGGRLGPDLSQIGTMRSVEHLRQSVLDPGADVQPRYWVVSFQDADGHEIQGFLMNEDTYTVQFIDLREQLHSYEKAALQNYKVEKVSKMPSYRDSLTNEQVNDLVQYLSSLRPH
jgi:putative heme-binding domain-containing protein